jgi:diketogulonate reductase-like aldo/keto reductase
VLVPLESALRSLDKFQLNYLELYLLHSQLILHYLHRLGLANSFERKLIDDNIEKLIKKYVKYET